MADKGSPKPTNPSLWSSVKAQAKKTSPARKSWPVTPSGKRKKQ